MKEECNIGGFSKEYRSTIYQGSCLDFLKEIPDKSVQLVVTSPPYGIGKTYEKKCDLNDYLSFHKIVIKECVRVLKDTGSICWQVGNYIQSNEIVPLDVIFYPICKQLGLKLRNRIVWTFGHGLHYRKRLSGRYETILWFTKTDDYIFNLDEIRIPQKYPKKKYFKGKKKGLFSCNPLGKNPTDVWEIPNVKHNHCEKTEHPCQFPIGLIERLILALTSIDDIVFDPFSGVASSLCAAILHRRIGIGCEIVKEYNAIGKKRVELAIKGELVHRPLGKPVFESRSTNQ